MPDFNQWGALRPEDFNLPANLTQSLSDPKLELERTHLLDQLIDQKRRTIEERDRQFNWGTGGGDQSGKTPPALRLIATNPWTAQRTG